MFIKKARIEIFGVWRRFASNDLKRAADRGATYR